LTADIPSWRVSWEGRPSKTPMEAKCDGIVFFTSSQFLIFCVITLTRNLRNYVKKNSQNFYQRKVILVKKIIKIIRMVFEK
jgi:hypothetical protein